MKLSFYPTIGFGITVPVGQDRQKIILKINAKILGKLFFQKINFLYGENKNLLD
jgi:hypothetical protein